MIKYDCHIHALLDGSDWKASIARHREKPQEDAVRAALAAARAGVDSIEHGAYLDREALQAMAEQKVLWVPTVSTVGNLLGKGRFPDEEVEKILENVQENIRCFVAMGGLLAPGSDAGAWAVPHGLGGQSEYAWLEKTLGSQADAVLAKGGEVLFSRFSGN